LLPRRWGGTACWRKQSSDAERIEEQFSAERSGALHKLLKLRIARCEKETRMILNVGKRIVYPYRGPCRIGAVVKKDIGGRAADFYPLVLMDDSGDVLFVPVDKAENLGIRQLVKRSEIPKLLRRLTEEVGIVDLPNTRTSWKQRAMDNFNLFASGSAFDLATIVGSLSELNEIKPLSPRDREVLDKARKNLICEISVVMGEPKSAAEKQIDDSLRMRMRRKSA
jgi:CarD family transcriptional regulator